MKTNEPTTPSAIRSGEPLWCADCKSYHPIGLHTDTPSAAPTPETDAEWEKEENSNRYPHQYVSAKFARRLERERDEARAELARLKANNRYQRGYHDGEQAAREELKTPTPPTEGSAVEWAQTKMITREDIDGDLFKCLQEDDALELARRADEAEFWAKSWKANHDNQVRLKRALADRPDLKERAASWKKLNDDNEALRAQLAAAQQAKQPEPLTRPDRPGWWWVWSEHGTPPRWLPVVVQPGWKCNDGIWVEAAPPPAPTGKEGQG